MKLRLILNPRSGPARRRKARHEAIGRALDALRLDCEVVETRGPGDATVLARRALAEGCTGIVAAGGDGTVNEIAQVLAGTDATLAFVPSGSGNGLARHLGIPLAPEPALGLLSPGAGMVERIDTADVNGGFFCNAMGFGFDAETAARFSAYPGRGLIGYGRAAWRAWREFEPVECEIEGPAGRWTQPVWLLAIANSDQYGNDVRIAPAASVSDGLLDLVVVAPVGFLGAAGLFGRVVLGRPLRDPRVRRAVGAAFTIRLPGPGRIHVDGEVRPTGPLITVRVRPRSLRVLVPARRDR